jgi:20S proteasome alpha/beta subunit
MTICIAVLAENSTKIVIAADQMITANIPVSYQFETENVKKIYPIPGKNAVIMTAGNAIAAYEIVEKVKRKIAASAETETVEQIAEIARSIYQDVRRRQVVERFLNTRGLDLGTYLSNQRALHEGVVSEIEKALQGWSIDVDLIIAGGDSDSCHIYNVSHPGVTDCHDPVGYVCVGSGSPHAMYYLIGSKYKKSMKVEDVKKLVSGAKKRSEVAPGVGKHTTIEVINLKQK